MIHMRLVVPDDLKQPVLDLVCAAPAVASVICLENAARKPPGHVILADVAREDASVIVGDLRELDLDRRGTIALDYVDTSISDAATAAEKAAHGTPSDAVVWEQVESRTSEETEMSFAFLAFMVIAMLIAGVGVLTDSRSSSSGRWSAARSSARSPRSAWGSCSDARTWPAGR